MVTLCVHVPPRAITRCIPLSMCCTPMIASWPPGSVVASVSARVTFSWMMATIAAKHAVSGDVVYVDHLSLGLNNLVREVRELVTGVPPGYQRGSLTGAVVPLGDPSAAIQGLCTAMLALTPDLVALGGAVPPNPMHVVDALLALAPETP